jgi:Na+/proline symporter
MIILITVVAYFGILFLISRFTARTSNNDAFYRGNRRSPWYMVAFGMVGASISGITFVSVPGLVITGDMTYIQMCIGFIFGYFLVAFVLLPVYYRLNLTTIYSYLRQRIGERAYKTGASFFLLSKTIGAAVRFYVVCFILHTFVLASLGVPFALTVVVMVMLIWLYTRRGGIKTLVWTDTFQTLCMFAALVLIIYYVVSALGMSSSEAIAAICADSHSRIFEFDDWVSKQHFLKQFLSGIFVVLVMTGLDQDMMQKNLTCKTLKDARKDMCTYGFAFVPVNLLFLSLGVLLMMLARQQGVALPEKSDDLLCMFAATGELGNIVVVLFTIGVVAASFSSADSAMTALTTSFCVDIMNRENDERLRKRVHFAVALVFVVFILAFKVINSTSVIDAIYILCGYTYGPLLGLFAYGLLTKRHTSDRFVPYVCVVSPVLCFVLDMAAQRFYDYHFGYELLMLNGFITFAGLWISEYTNRNTNR